MQEKCHTDVIIEAWLEQVGQWLYQVKDPNYPEESVEAIIKLWQIYIDNLDIFEVRELNECIRMLGTNSEFAKVAQRIAEWQPDLIIQLGDYIYQEQQCPAGCALCQGPRASGLDR